MNSWDGRVLEIDGDTFTALLSREGAPDLMADFSMEQCKVTVELGDLLIVTPDSVTVRDLGVWTKRELRAIKKRARRYARTMRRLAS